MCSFIKAKSEVATEDVSGLIEFGLELFRVSENKLYAQVIIICVAQFVLCVFAAMPAGIMFQCVEMWVFGFVLSRLGGGISW